MGEKDVSEVAGVILLVAITVILAASIAAFVLDVGQSTRDPNETPTNKVTVNSDDGGISTALVTIFSGAILFLGREVWNLNSEVEYLKGKLDSMENRDQTFEFEEESKQNTPKKKAPKGTGQLCGAQSVRRTSEDRTG